MLLGPEEILLLRKHNRLESEGGSERKREDDVLVGEAAHDVGEGDGEQHEVDEGGLLFVEELS